MFADLGLPLALGQHRKGPERQVDPFQFVGHRCDGQIAWPEPTVRPQPLAE